MARGRPGQGTFVIAETASINTVRLSALRESFASGWLAEARSAGIDDDAIVALVLNVIADNSARGESRLDETDSTNGNEIVA